jgi:gliding motility-associated-like protein
MGAQRRPFFLPLLFGLFFALSGQAQVDFDLEVDVVMDTVLYGGFVGADEVVPDGFRRYRLYAVFPDDVEIMLGPAADDSSDPSIPGFGYSSDCGCFNTFGAGGTFNFDTGAEILPAYLPLFPEVQYDTWWTTHISQSTPGTNVIEPAGTFPIGFDSCEDLVLQGGLLVTNADPVHASVTDGRALIGQITTCESFSFQVCVSFQNGGVVTTSCTDGFVEVSDLCAPMIDPQVTVMEEIDCFGETASFGVEPNDPSLAFTSTVEYSLFEVTGAGPQLVSQQVGNPDFTGVPAGEYFVTLLDTARTVAFSSNTCMDTTANVVFVTPNDIALTVDLTEDNLCGGEDVATICYTASGGTGALSTVAVHGLGLELAPDSATCFTNLSCYGGDGEYTITTTDEQGCTSDTSVVVSCPDPIVFDVDGEGVSCAGEEDGSFSGSVQGGTGLVSVVVDEIALELIVEGFLEFDQDAIASGLYTFEILDENGCGFTDSLSIPEPDSIAVTYAVTDVACAGECNGLVLVSASGGSQPFTYALVDLDGQDANPGQLCPGGYVHTTTDGNGCSVADTVTVNGPDTIQFNFITSNVPCSGADNGLICLDSLSGGTGPLQPQLVPLPTNSLDGNCFNVPAGNYTVLVTDSLGCVSASFETTVEEPANIEILPTITPISCTGAGDGVLVVNAVGGSGALQLTSPFVFASLPDTLVGLGPDSLNLVVADTLGCIDSLLVGIPEPEPVALDILSSVLPECGGDCTGGIEVTLEGGTGSLTLYQGSISDSTAVVASGLVNLCADDYALYLVDEENCTDSAFVSITEPDPLLFDITVQNVTCTGMNDGVAIIGTIGGSGETAWEFVGEDVDVLNLFEGEYSVSAADTAGCTADSTFLVAADIVTDMVVEIFTTPVTCWQTSDGTATAAVTGGQLPIHYEWSDPAGQSTATAIGLSEDVYSVVVTDDIGCTLGFLATVDPTEDCLFIADAITPNGDGVNDRWVVGGLEFFPQSEVEVFNRWGQLLFRSQPGTTWWDGTFNGALLPASDYYYVITVFPGAAPITGTVTLKY